MLSYKPCLALGALLLVSFAVSTTAECKDCLGANLTDVVTSLEKTVKCLFHDKSSKHFMQFELLLIDLISGELTELLKSSTGNVPTNCIKAIQTEVCEKSEQNKKAACHYENIYSLAQTYADLEQCSGKVINAPLLETILGFMKGVVVGVEEVHKC